MAYPTATLNELGSVERGRSRHRPRNDPALYGGSYPFIQTGDVKDVDLWIRESSQSYSDVGLKQSRLWDVGTVCITIAANIAESAVLGIPACFPDSIVGVIPNRDVAHSLFIKYAIDYMQEQLHQVSHGTTQDNLSLDKLLRFRFPCPDLPTQQRIVSVLGRVDVCIDLKLAQVDALRRTLSTLYDFWFVERAYADKVLRVSDTELGSIPIDWAVAPMRDALPFWPEKPKIRSYVGERVYLATADVQGFHQIGEGTLLPFDQLPSRAQLRPVTGSVWIGRMAGYAKVLAFPQSYPEVDEYVLSSGLLCIRAPGPWWSYVAATVDRPQFEELKARYATGATQVALTDAAAAGIPWIVPEEAIVIEFARIAEPVVALLVNVRREIARLRELRDLLLPALLSGELTVGHVPIDLDGLD